MLELNLLHYTVRRQGLEMVWTTNTAPFLIVIEGFRWGHKKAAFGNTVWCTRSSLICIAPREALRKEALAWQR